MGTLEGHVQPLLQRQGAENGEAPSSTCDVCSEVARSWRYFESFLVSRASFVQIAQTKTLENALN